MERDIRSIFSPKSWRIEEHHKEKVAQLKEELEKAFTDHPAETGETYLQHLWFTIRMSARFLVTSIVMLTHGVFPFLFCRTASKQVEQVYRMMRRRIPKARRVEIDSIFEV